MKLGMVNLWSSPIDRTPDPEPISRIFFLSSTPTHAESKTASVLTLNTEAGFCLILNFLN